MVRGFCCVCRKEVGGFLKPAAWQCPSCRRIYCPTCPKKTVGRYFRKPVCPECSIELHEDGVNSQVKDSFW